MATRHEWTTWRGFRAVARTAAALGARVVIHESLYSAGVAPAVCRHTPPAFITESPVPRIAPVHIAMPADSTLQPVVGVLADRDRRAAAGPDRVATPPRPTAVMLSLPPHTHDLRKLPKFAGTTIRMNAAVGADSTRHGTPFELDPKGGNGRLLGRLGRTRRAARSASGTRC